MQKPFGCKKFVVSSALPSLHLPLFQLGHMNLTYNFRYTSIGSFIHSSTNSHPRHNRSHVVGACASDRLATNHHTLKCVPTRLETRCSANKMNHCSKTCSMTKYLTPQSPRELLFLASPPKVPPAEIAILFSPAILVRGFRSSLLVIIIFKVPLLLKFNYSNYGEFNRSLCWWIYQPAAAEEISQNLNTHDEAVQIFLSLSLKASTLLLGGIKPPLSLDHGIYNSIPVPHHLNYLFFW